MRQKLGAAKSRRASMDPRPFDQGVTAASDGLPASANPYPEGTAARASWDEGYHSLIDHPDSLDTEEDTGNF
jgi:hypothetical protein